ARFHAVDHLVVLRSEIFSHLIAHASRPARDAPRVALVQVPKGTRVGEVVEAALLRLHDGEARDQAIELLRAAMGAGSRIGRGIRLEQQTDAAAASLAAVVVDRHRGVRYVRPNQRWSNTSSARLPSTSTNMIASSQASPTTIWLGSSFTRSGLVCRAGRSADDRNLSPIDSLGGG